LINFKNYFAELLQSSGPILTSELFSPDHYEGLRQEILGVGLEHKRRRRVRLNEALTILFESRATIWIQIHEELRWLSGDREEEKAEILKANNLISPSAKSPTATIFVDGYDPTLNRECADALSHNTLTIDLISDGWTYSAVPIRDDTISKGLIHSRKFLRGERSKHENQIRVMGAKIAGLSPVGELSAPKQKVLASTPVSWLKQTLNCPPRERLASERKQGCFEFL
jgi:hypothetical protein